MVVDRRGTTGGSTRAGSSKGFAAAGVQGDGAVHRFLVDRPTLLPTEDPKPPSGVCHVKAGQQILYDLREPALPREPLIAFDKLARSRILAAFADPGAEVRK